jgi:hypothetical protein
MLLMLASMAAPAAAASKRPHICFILADDWGQCSPGG